MLPRQLHDRLHTRTMSVACATIADRPRKPRAVSIVVSMIAVLALTPSTGRMVSNIVEIMSEHSVAVHAEPADVGPAPASRPATVVRPVSCTALPDIAGKSIVTAIVDFPPGAFSPRHRHPGTVTAFVMSGTLRSQLAGEAIGTYTVGQTWFEPPGALHIFAENASATAPAQLLAIFIVDHDCGPLTVPE
jgi:quercetin dioxygenase-like cupin family protein